MDSIVIDKMRDVIIVERAQNDTIPKDSLLFCGCCGKKLGMLKSDITFPFDHNKLMAHLKDITFTVNILGLRHDSCGHTMFSFQKEWGFMLSIII